MSHAVAWNLAATEFLSAFTISENQHLTLRTFDPTKGADAVSTNADDLPQGPIVPGSSLAAINLLNWTRVFGWVDGSINGPGLNENHLYMLSPVHQWINKTRTAPKNTGLAGLSTGTSSYLYYVETSNKIVELLYNGLGAGRSSPTQLNKSVALLPSSSVAACMTVDSSASRIVAYQLPDNKLQTFNTKTRSSSTLEDSYPRPNTPLAIITYMSSSDLVTNLYFLSKDDPPRLQRAKLVPGEDWVIKTIPDATPDSATSLTTVWSTALKKVMVIYQTATSEMAIYQDA